jgi:hypothetical protein
MPSSRCTIGLAIESSIRFEVSRAPSSRPRGDRGEARRFEVRGSRFEVRGSRFEVRGSRFEVRGSRFEVGAIVIEGTASTAKFTRRAHNSFAIAERAADTAAALRGLGFSRHEVAAAMDKTRAHVGAAELTLQQWITIALGYCPKPRA